MTNSKKQSTGASEQQIDLWNFLAVIINHRKMIFRNCLVMLVLSVLISLVLPKKYTAIATLLPPEQSSRGTAFGNFSTGVLPNLNLLNTNTTADLFVQILGSRSVQQAVVERTYLLDNSEIALTDYLDADNIQAGVKKLADITTIQASPEGIISIAVEIGDPVLAAAVANAYVAELDSVNQAKSTSRAKSSRVYIENQLELTKERLKQADERLAEFMQTHKAVSLEDQTRAAIEESGEIKGKIIAREVELALKEKVRKPTHQEILALKAEIAELKKQYTRLQYGSEAPTVEDEKEFYIPMVEVPDVSLQLAELMREVKVQETVFELLNQQFYQAKIQEAKDTPTVQALDEAVPPEFKSKPKRSLIVLLTVGSIFLLSIFWAFLTEYWKNLSKDEENRERISWLRNVLSSDFNRVKQCIQKKSNR